LYFSTTGVQFSVELFFSVARLSTVGIDTLLFYCACLKTGITHSGNPVGMEQDLNFGMGRSGHRLYTGVGENHHHHHHVRVAGEGRRVVAPPCPPSTARLQSSSVGRRVESFRSWSSRLFRGRPVGRRHVRSGGRLSDTVGETGNVKLRPALFPV